MKYGVSKKAIHTHKLASKILKRKNRITDLLDNGYPVPLKDDALKERFKTCKSLSMPKGFVVRQIKPTEGMTLRGTKENSECLNQNTLLSEYRYRHPKIQVYKAMISELGERP
jgi:hypothetical protein